MWKIRSKLDFLIVKQAMLGVRDAIIGQLGVLALLVYSLYMQIPETTLGIWLFLHVLNYFFRYQIYLVYIKLTNNKENYPLASALVRLYTISLAFTSILWGSAFFFSDAFGEGYRLLLFAIVIGFTFASVLSIGPIFSMHLAFTLPMNIAALLAAFTANEKVFYAFGIFIIMSFLYSLRTSRAYFRLYTSLIEEKLNVQNALKKLELKEQNKTEYLDAMAELGIGMALVDENDKIVEFNLPMQRWFRNLEGMEFPLFLEVTFSLQKKLTNKMQLTTQDDHHFEVTSKNIYTTEEKLHTLYIFKNITNETHYLQTLKNEKALYKKRSQYDPLTELFNRDCFLQELDAARYEADRTFNKIALLFIDLDNFKHINDTYGHDVGDQVLKIIAKRMRHNVRHGDLLGRFAGDEFIIALKQLESKQNIEPIVTQLLYALSKPIKIATKESVMEIDITVSIGISIYPDDDREISQLVTKADKAMYSIKRARKNGYAFYNKNTKVTQDAKSL